MNEVQLLGYIKFFACLQVLILPVNEFLQPEIKPIADKILQIQFGYFGCCVPFHLSLLFKLNSFFNLVVFSTGIHKNNVN